MLRAEQPGGFGSMLSHPRYLEFLRAYGDAYGKGTECSDERLLSLPHHKRIALNDALALETRFLEAFCPAVIAEAQQPDSSRHSIAETMLQESPFIAQHVYKGRFDLLCDVALRTMIHCGRIHTFQTTDALETMLLATDFGNEVPAQWFLPPFRDIYIEFGEHRRFPLTMHDPASGEHVVEGCYLLSGMSAPMTRPGPLVRGFDVIIFGSPTGKLGVTNDCFVHMGLPIDDESVSMHDLVDGVIRHYEARDDFPNAAVFRPVLTHVAKILVYLATPEARKVVNHDGSDAARRIAGMKSGSKKAKAERQAWRLYDRIVVGPSSLPGDMGAVDDPGATIRPHVRRGHIRAQAYGPQHSLRRPQWIQPTLVGRTSLGVSSSPYIVR